MFIVFISGLFAQRWARHRDRVHAVQVLQLFASKIFRRPDDERKIYASLRTQSSGLQTGLDRFRRNQLRPLLRNRQNRLRKNSADGSFEEEIILFFENLFFVLNSILNFRFFFTCPCSLQLLWIINDFFFLLASFLLFRPGDDIRTAIPSRLFGSRELPNTKLPSSRTPGWE